MTGIATDHRVSLEERIVYFDYHFDHPTGSLLFRFVVGGGIDEVLDYVARAALKA